MNLSAKRMRLRTNTSRLGRTSDWSLDFCSNSNFSEVKKSKCYKREQTFFFVCALTTVVSVDYTRGCGLYSILCFSQESRATAYSVVLACH